MGPPSHPPGSRGCSQPDTVEKRSYDRKLVRLEQLTDGRLTSLCIDLTPSSSVTHGLAQIGSQGDHVLFHFAEWGGGRTEFRGIVKEDGGSIKAISSGRYRLKLERLDDVDAEARIARFQTMLRTSREPTFRIAAPVDVEDGWTTGSAAENGLDPATLERLVERILHGKYDDLHDLLIVRNGKLVFEEYFRADGHLHGALVNETYRQRKHLWASATKSVTTLLVGLAIDQGAISGVDVPVFDFFPELTVLRTPAKAKIRLEHLLTMTTGLEWQQSNESPRDVPGMWKTDDVIRFVLEKPVAADPGTEFNYSNGISTVLGAIVAKATGLRTDAFSREYLFGRLGIDDLDRQSYPDGSIDTDGGLSARPRDMAKIGLLVLQRGRWADRRVVSPE